jgi:hypothetical protein
LNDYHDVFEDEFFPSLIGWSRRERRCTQSAQAGHFGSESSEGGNF